MKQPTHLRLVDPSSPVPTKGSAVDGRWQEDDPDFFHKSQIKLSTRLRYRGRTDHGRLFEVVEIRTWRQGPSGTWRSYSVDHVEKLSDDITVREVGGNFWRKLRFSSLSYLVTWRIEP